MGYIPGMILRIPWRHCLSSKQQVLCGNDYKKSNRKNYAV